MTQPKREPGKWVTYDCEVHMSLLIRSLGAEGYSGTDESTIGNNLPQNPVARGSS